MVSSLYFLLMLVAAADDSKQKPCADFNYASSAGAIAGLEHAFVCPFDGVAQTHCSEHFPLKSAQDIKQKVLELSNVLFYVLVGPKSKVDAFKWWLPLLQGVVDIAIVADPCPKDNVDCDDSASHLVSELIEHLDHTYHGPPTAKESARAIATGMMSRDKDSDVKKSPSHVSKDRNITFTLLRVNKCDVGYDVLSCKLRTGQRLAYQRFPNKMYYFKFDTDTLIFPSRLQHFLQTLDTTHASGGWKADPVVSTHQSIAIQQQRSLRSEDMLLTTHRTSEGGTASGSRILAPSDGGLKRSSNNSHTQRSSNQPIYFGAVRESGGNLLLCGTIAVTKTHGDRSKGGLCYAQGGAGYGLNNRAMAIMAASPACTDELNQNKSTRDTTPEDAYTALRMYEVGGINVIHCGGFDSSEVVNDRKLRNSITFHYIDSAWLRQHGATLLKHYHNHNNARGVHN